ncbi:LysR family transcriptional regulator [Agathobaculum sp. NTUH-O15-33]|uniref:LysR family transcriptional regulator n=1 Tax=Agathobaculum sp. NTUH-O15-33 TaxID=3079302 RepID=UPI002958AB3B|nr:LysR family transcriptional regulator [Agathobaculum sp. NTUH-O15-33]WNX84947.1 LysR family transcriptional regulator [Agathobaculum sp. NTUH-O15-33]
MLDFRVDTFLAVCRCQSFTKAAEELHITQPAVSQHIHWLESAYGARFFAWQGKRMELTEAGRLFLRAATTMRDDALHLKMELGSLADRGRRLTFGATLTVGEYVMPRALARLFEREPGAEVRMQVANTAELLQKLDNGEIDFAIVEGFFEKNEYDHLPYRTERFVPVASPGFVFQKPVRELGDLLGERLLTRELGSGTRETLERRLRESNLTVADFRRVAEIGSLNAIKTLVRAGCGVSFLYEPTVHGELQTGEICEIPLADFSVTHDFTFLWRKNSAFADEHRAAYALLQE